jgi:hypothetical protein
VFLFGVVGALVSVVRFSFLFFFGETDFLKTLEVLTLAATFLGLVYRCFSALSP